ncbi:MAG TPA: hypothetical protein VFB45_10435 [Pseudolabrys sp.]|nr:hypothetical protein [Pseudolabrys sp.]
MKLQEVADRVKAMFDAASEMAISGAQRAAARRYQSLGEAYRGKAIDLAVRDGIECELLLQNLKGDPNSGVDFTDTKTGVTYELTTRGQWIRKLRKYAPPPLFINTGRVRVDEEMLNRLGDKSLFELGRRHQPRRR